MIGLPGDSIQMIDGVLHINGTAGQARARRGLRRRARRARAHAPVKRWKETLPNGVSYYTLDLVDNGFSDNTPGLHVPRRPLFHDGRQPRQLDRQPRSQPGRLSCRSRTSSARAQIIFFSVYEGERAWEFWRWPWSVRWNRLFTIVR